MNKIKTAVLGLGRLGYWHAVNVSKIRGAELSIVCDMNEETAAKLTQELEVPSYTTNPDDVFQNDDIRAVIISSPTSTHYELLKKAAESGKAVFVEKPLTIDLDEAYSIQKLMKEKNTLCQVGFMRRFDPAYDAAKKRIEAGDIGQPIYYRGISRDAHAPHEAFIEHSGGIFVDVSIHDFDIARYLMNAEVSSVAAHGRILKHSFMEKYGDIDQSLAYLEFDSGAAGDVESSRNAYYGYDIRAEVIGTEGSIFIGDLRHRNIHILTKSGKTHDLLPDFPVRFVDAYTIELEDFFRIVQLNETPRVTVHDGVKALEIALAARQSFQTGQKINMAK
ncbi:oxidoreductase [Domibacillus antri]|uniref:Oxidoreductase n=1 Tax=Domibacillus antri TaxID=1714264 RepID=A0A1Q8Q996_9BACI|nr:Gfo/Idh/MocA family oxidoreductase [Domibacillus antri]OLN23907.1 oxidoreductase [Domibacillus antri]